MAINRGGPPLIPPPRDSQCPRRGAGLSHVQDNKTAPDGSCIHCGQLVRRTPFDGVPKPLPSDGKQDERTITTCRACQRRLPCYRGRRLPDIHHYSGTVFEDYMWLCAGCFGLAVKVALTGTPGEEGAADDPA